ncbi:MAG: M3 family metallopeptidase [Proteobacteria bacterium]|nr:M3 family metallopeptidase [Pseudomonadota bacterium]
MLESSASENDPGHSDNPLLMRWEAAFAMPPFDRLRTEHFMPAFEFAMKEHRLELEAITHNPERPDFQNTMVALERCGENLQRVMNVFYNLTSSHTSAELQAIEREMAPRLAAHFNAMMLDPKLFERVDDLHRRADHDELDAESRRMLARWHLDFVRSGAKLAEKVRLRFAAITEELATLYTDFSQNVLHDESSFTMILRSDDELSGLPDFVRAAARQAAIERGVDGDDAHVITLSRSSVTPFMTFSERRELRQNLWQAWCARGEHAGARDNRPLIVAILKCRHELATLLGYPDYASYALEDSMAGNPQAALGLLERVWEPARQRAEAEKREMEALARKQGQVISLEAHDWHFWAERLRKARYDLEESELKPYLQLDRMVQAMFEVAQRLFGLVFKPIQNAKLYHPSVKAWEVLSADAEHIGVFLGDNFARASKRSGAWMSTYRDQHALLDPQRPIVVNNNNFSQSSGPACLLSLDDAHTLFHEFGHGLHGLLSRVTYPKLAGTRVLRDFVEFPSQLFEHWLLQPEVLKRHAIHVQSGEPMPDALIDKILKAKTFNQGFASVEYLACALADLDLHQRSDFEGLDLDRFEQELMTRIGMPKAIGLRHRLPHFLHLFSGSGYASAYYVYLWAEVLDADGFEAFVEAGDPFDPVLAKRLHDHVYSAGNRQEPMQAYVAFRGREPAVEALLRQRGLQASSALS